MAFAELMSEFYNGVCMLDMIAKWAYVVESNQKVLEYLKSFEEAYEKLVALNEAGKLGAGTADLSPENLERAKRINRLLQPGLDSDEARQAAQEIRTLAEQCYQGLTRKKGSSTGG